ncbi:MAG: NAD(P)/FAD-dependent oxidoreductase, partial [Flavobacteriales bacterium]
ALQLNKILKGGIMLRPEGEDRYQVAASFDWEDLTYNKTEKGRQWLLDRLDTMINCPYTVVDHKVGIRPTVKDRRPLLGRHPKHRQMYVFNGMGTRGLMLAPYGISMLLDKIEFGTALDQEWDIKRFETC